MSSIADRLTSSLKARVRRHRDLKANRSWLPIDQKRADFYSQFFKTGDLVFDVGANVGNRSKIFLKLGARVVAFEPQAYCLAVLRKSFQSDRNIVIVPKGLGRCSGIAVLNTSDAHTISSMSDNFIEATTSTGRFGGTTWNSRVEIEISTLDQEIRAHGLPRFIKIDVEGFESEVLAGLSRGVGALSFEFTPELLPVAQACIETCAQLGMTEFQLSLGESMTWSQSDWQPAERMIDVLRQIKPPEFGDIYARRPE